MIRIKLGEMGQADPKTEKLITERFSELRQAEFIKYREIKADPRGRALPTSFDNVTGKNYDKLIEKGEEAGVLSTGRVFGWLLQNINERNIEWMGDSDDVGRFVVSR